MKKKIAVFLFVSFILIFAVACSNDKDMRIAELEAEIFKLKSTPIPTEQVAVEPQPQETETPSVTIAQELANEFNNDFSSGYGKKLEDAWKSNKNDTEVAAMYFYYNALFYDSIGQPDMAMNEMKNVSPNYSGVMSKEIIEYGLKLFGSKSAWTDEKETKEEHKASIIDKKRQEIKDWIYNRYDYYDALEGKYCGDKYTETIFNEAAGKFGYTYQEIYNIWSDLPI